MSSSLGRCGRYELLRFLDAGGMGEVFVARGPAPQGEPALVAIKRLVPYGAHDRHFVGMFMDEAHVATLLDHPNIARVYRAGRDEDHYFLVMEWVEGASLRSLVRRIPANGPIPWAIAARIIADAAAGLEHAHGLTDPSGLSYGIVHRDVSPANIMVGYDGRTRLLDFGLAKARTQLEKTKPGTVKGKFAYLAPEQLRGEVAPAVDVFGLGLCLWEALTGEQLFGEGTAAETMARVSVYEGAPPVRGAREEVPPALDAVLARALAPRPADRFGTVTEVRAALERVLASESRTVSEADVAAWVRAAHPERIELPDTAAETPSAADLVDASVPPPALGRRWALLAAALVAIGLAIAAALLH
jgi:serine/threonine-protein kinase